MLAKTAAPPKRAPIATAAVGMAPLLSDVLAAAAALDVAAATPEVMLARALLALA